MTIDSQLLRKSALEIVELLRAEAISPIDLLDTLRLQVERTEPYVNALPTLCWERAYEHAHALLKKPVHERGLLCGLPVPIKDLTPVAGVRTTFGSRLYRDYIPERSDAMVTRLEERGAIIYAKSNSPEFGAGGHTTNTVYGLTRNPWNLQRSAGGSSGGAAAALAAHSAWLAQGSDLAGSLRTPAAFCGVVGLRPTPGRIGDGPSRKTFDTLAVDGPMARNVTDVALLLDALCGAAPQSPLSVGDAGVRFLDYALQPKRPLRVAFSPDLGMTPVDPEIARVCRQAVETLAAQGFAIELVELDLSAARQAFYTLRGTAFATNYSGLLETHRHELDPNVVWNIEYGLKLDAKQIRDANSVRASLYQEAVQLFDSYDVLLCPASIVPAFPVEQGYVREAAGRQFETYIDWLAITYALTMLSLPVLSLPCGMTSDNLPVGMQIVGKPRGEAELLSIARAIELALGEWATSEPELNTLLDEQEQPRAVSA